MNDLGIPEAFSASTAELYVIEIDPWGRGATRRARRAG